LRIFVLGVDSTPDPYAGVGVARSLRQAFPECELVALDRSPASSGLSWIDFDTSAIVRSRAALNRLCDAMRPNEYLIPCTDEDIRWLARRVNARRVLAPNRGCLSRLRKPSGQVARLLGVGAPESLVVPADHRTVDRFIAGCDSGIWLKGIWSGAERVTPRQARVCATRVPLPYRDGRGRALLQAHIPGPSHALSFAAYQGRLVQSAWMEKLGVTRSGKTWSGTVTNPSREWGAALVRVVRHLAWHGGGDFEFVGDSSSRMWLIDGNPRFAAWIHGATLAGTNLPAALIGAASGDRPRACTTNSSTFTRVVIETSVQESLVPHITRHVVE